MQWQIQDTIYSMDPGLNIYQWAKGSTLLALMKAASFS